MLRTLSALFLLLILSHAALSGSRSIQVIDGDTIRTADGKVRLLGCDAPETFFAKCVAEHDAGLKATTRLKALIENAKEVHVDYGQPKRADRWGRWLGQLILDGEDACGKLIREGLARPYDGKKRGTWCP